MTSFKKLPLSHVAKFLTYQERVELASSSKSMHQYLAPTLSSIFDIELTYESFRSSYLHAKKHKKSQTPIDFHSLLYQPLDLQIFSLPSILKRIPFTYETSENGNSIFKNRFGDMLILHSSLVEVPTIEDPSSFNFLADANDLNENIDFTNPAMLLRRQQKLLDKVRKYREERFEFQKKSAMKHLRNWGETVVILCHGGNFNLASFKANGQLNKSQSDHKYVARKKQGGRQSTADKQGSGIHSKGASIRRENEKKHAENIESILDGCERVLDSASLIFLHAPGINYFTFIGENGLLQKWKDKVRAVGITTGKAKLQETERVFSEISKCRLLIRVIN